MIRHDFTYYRIIILSTCVITASTRASSTCAQGVLRVLAWTALPPITWAFFLFPVSICAFIHYLGWNAACARRSQSAHRFCFLAPPLWVLPPSSPPPTPSTLYGRRALHSAPSSRCVSLRQFLCTLCLRAAALSVFMFLHVPDSALFLLRLLTPCLDFPISCLLCLCCWVPFHDCLPLQVYIAGISVSILHCSMMVFFDLRCSSLLLFCVVSAPTLVSSGWYSLLWLPLYFLPCVMSPSLFGLIFIGYSLCRLDWSYLIGDVVQSARAWTMAYIPCWAIDHACLSGMFTCCGYLALFVVYVIVVLRYALWSLLFNYSGSVECIWNNCAAPLVTYLHVHPFPLPQ